MAQLAERVRCHGICVLDLQLFRRLTMGHALLMGRKTYESIGKPLPGRDTFVLTKQANLEITGVKTIRSVEESYGFPRNKNTFRRGGAEIYRQLLPMCQGVHLTRVLAELMAMPNWTRST